MPKETIGRGSNQIEVAWGREQMEVQVATTNSDRLVAATVLKPDGRVGPGSAEPVPEGNPFDGWHASLDRYHINALIRVLRRARDQACGADE